MNKRRKNKVHSEKNGALPDFHPFISPEAKEQFLKYYNELEEQWPVMSEIVMIDTSYGRTLVRVSGSASNPPLVLLHGMGTNSLSWKNQIQALSEQYRTYAPDSIYDFGLSVHHRPVSTPDDFVRWLDELFLALGLKNDINLTGMSYGGWQTALYTLSFPEKLRKIVLIAPAATVLPARPSLIIRSLFMAISHKYFYKSFLRWFFKDFMKKDKSAAEMAIEGVVRASRCFKSKRSPNPTVLTDDELAGINVPALFIVGENEKIYRPRKAIQKLKAVAPHIRSMLIPGAGHDLLVVQPEMINQAILKFFKES